MELASYGNSTFAQVADLIKQRAVHESELSKSLETLAGIAERALPIALAGPVLCLRVTERLVAEAKREQRLAAAGQTRQEAERFLRAFDDRLDQVAPPLSIAQRGSVRTALRDALDQLWHPAPEGAADDFRHGHAVGPLRDEVRQRLRDAAHLSARSLTGMVDIQAKATAALREINRLIDANQTTAGPQQDAKRERLQSLQRRIGELRKEEGEKSNILSSREEDLSQKLKDLKRQTGALDHSARPARLAQRAYQIVAMLERFDRRRPASPDSLDRCHDDCRDRGNGAQEGPVSECLD